nr:metalloregulator ArsR/SmtB family transcription factor [Bacillus sp. REN3]
MAEILEEAKRDWPIAAAESELEVFASFFKGLSDETRLKIMAMLLNHDLCMCEITSALKAAPSTISHHLRILEKGKVIHSRREGKFTIYSLDEQAGKLLKLLKEGVSHV